MKRLLYIIAIIFLISCKKENNEFLKTTVDETAITNSGIGDPYEWQQRPVPIMNGDPNNDPTDGNKIITVNGDVYCLMGGALLTTYKLNNNTKLWEKYIDNSPGNAVFAGYGAGMQYIWSYGSKIYGGLGTGAYDFDRHIAGKDPITYDRVDIPQFPGTPVSEATTFVIGYKGYILGGKNINNYLVNQAWEYNFVTHQWTNRGNSPLGSRAGAIALVADGKAYIGLGYGEIILNNTHIQQYKNDWVQYNPTSASIIKANFPGSKRTSAKGFVLSGNPFVGFGRNASNTFKDFWKYDPSSDTWTEQQLWPGAINSNYGNNIALFSQGNSGYLVKGSLGQFWRFSNSPVIIF